MVGTEHGLGRDDLLGGMVSRSRQGASGDPQGTVVLQLKDKAKKREGQGRWPREVGGRPHVNYES